jgi:hypothetical protein
MISDRRETVNRQILPISGGVLPVFGSPQRRREELALDWWTNQFIAVEPKQCRSGSDF